MLRAPTSARRAHVTALRPRLGAACCDPRREGVWRKHLRSEEGGETSPPAVGRRKKGQEGWKEDTWKHEFRALCRDANESAAEKMTVYCLMQWMGSSPVLARLREEGKLVDVHLRAKEGLCVAAHRVVLAGASRFFDALFAGPCSDMKDGCTEIVELPDVELATLEILVDAIYRQEVQVDESNVHALLAGSNLLDIPAVHKACCLFMQKSLSPKNALAAYALASRYAPNSSLRSEALLIAARSFQALREDQEDFQAALESMSKHTIVELLQSEHLDVEAEIEVFEVLCDWVSVDVKTRISDFSECLVRAIRLPLIPLETLKSTVLMHPLVKQNPQSREVVFAAQDGLQRRSLGKPLHQSSDAIPVEVNTETVVEDQSPHVGSMELEVCKLYPERMQGKAHGKECSAGSPIFEFEEGVHKQISSSNNWVDRVFIDASPRKRFATVLLAAGGYDDGWRGVRLAEIYDPLTNSWHPGPALPADLAFAGSSSVYDQNFVVGGSTFKTHVFAYRTGSQRLAYWENLVAPKAARVHAGITSAAGALYIIGGRSGSNVESSLVERFDPALGAWITAESLPSPRSSLDVVTVREKIYAIGGQAGRSTFRSVDMYDPTIDTWTTLQARMNTTRKYHATCACDGRIFVVGGKDAAGQRLSSVESMDPREGIWKYERDLSCRRSSAGLAALSGKLFVAGGNAGGGTIHSSVEELCLRTGVWSMRAPLNSARSGLTLLSMH